MITQFQLMSLLIKKFLTQRIITKKDILYFLLRLVMFAVRSWFFDITYYAISYDKLLELLEKWKNDVLANLKYKPEIFDCDDFANYFKVWMTKETGVNCTGEALGLVYKDGRLLGGHAWNIVIVHKHGVIDVLFVEPQLGEIIENQKTSDGWEYYLLAVLV